jgi:hypothetical protein
VSQQVAVQIQHHIEALAENRSAPELASSSSGRVGELDAGELGRRAPAGRPKTALV